MENTNPMEDLLNKKKKEIEMDIEVCLLKLRLFKWILILGTVVLAIIVTISSATKRVTIFDCLTVSLIVVSMFSSIKDFITSSPNSKDNLRSLKKDLNSVNTLLEKEKAENE